MAECRIEGILSIENHPVETRMAFIGSTADRAVKILADLFPESGGFRHRRRKRKAPWLQRQNPPRPSPASAEGHAMVVDRGPSWGVRLDITPGDSVPRTLLIRVQSDSTAERVAYWSGILLSLGGLSPVLSVSVDLGPILLYLVIATCAGALLGEFLMRLTYRLLWKQCKAIPPGQSKALFDRLAQAPDVGRPEPWRPDAPLDGGARCPV